MGAARPAVRARRRASAALRRTVCAARSGSSRSRSSSGRSSAQVEVLAHQPSRRSRAKRRAPSPRPPGSAGRGCPARSSRTAAAQLGVVRPRADVEVGAADRGPDVVDHAELGVHVDRRPSWFSTSRTWTRSPPASRTIANASPWPSRAARGRAGRSTSGIPGTTAMRCSRGARRSAAANTTARRRPTTGTGLRRRRGVWARPQRLGVRAGDAALAARARTGRGRRAGRCAGAGRCRYLPERVGCRRRQRAGRGLPGGSAREHLPRQP